MASPMDGTISLFDKHVIRFALSLANTTPITAWVMFDLICHWQILRQQHLGDVRVPLHVRLSVLVMHYTVKSTMKPKQPIQNKNMRTRVKDSYDTKGAIAPNEAVKFLQTALHRDEVLELPSLLQQPMLVTG